MTRQIEVDIRLLSEQLGALLAERGLVVGTAESCTGGWVAQSITAVPGSSDWFHSGFVTYSNQSKVEQLGIDPDLINQHGAVSKVVVENMVNGLLDRTTANCAIATSGIAGPSGGTTDKPVGTVWISVGDKAKGPMTRKFLFAGDREGVRYQSVLESFRLLERFLTQSKL
jgi:nicotinamide-nucleotide amidase